MNQVQAYYRFSGKTTARGMAFVNVVGVASALILGTIYGYGLRYIPYVYLKFFMTILAGLGVGGLIAWVSKREHMRNKMVVYYFGFLFGVGSWYVGWVSWLFASSNQSVLILKPLEILGVMKLIAVEGAWNLNGFPVAGFYLYLIWGLEALLIIGISTVVAGLSLKDEVYCEECHQWVKAEQSIYPLEQIRHPEDFKLQMERGDWTPLQTLKKLHPLSLLYTRLNLTHCPTCQMLHLLSVSAIEKFTTKKGEEKEKENILLQNFIIDASTYHMLLELDKPFVPAS